MLGDVIGRLSPKDPFRVSDLMKSVAGFGATGSGKTSGPARWLAEIIARHPRSSMLILAAKPEDAEQWKGYFARAGRELFIFEPSGERKFNVLDYVMKCGGDCRDVTRCLTSMSEVLRPSDGNRDEFWEQQQERAIYNAVILVKLALGNITVPDLQKFVTGAAKTKEMLTNPIWREEFHNQILRKAKSAKKTTEEEADFEGAISFYRDEIPNMADRTQSSILVGVFGLFHTLNTGMMQRLLSSDTNISPQAMLRYGKSVLVNAAPSVCGDTGKLINAAWKFATQWSVLRRAAMPDDFFNVIFVDEAQQFVNSMDADYLAQCRSHLGCMAFFTQSLHSYYAAMGAHVGKYKADTLLANLNLKIFCALGDAATAEWASDHCGRELQTRYGGSMAPNEGLWETLMGRSKVSGNFSTSYERVLEPKVFMHGLRTGGKENGCLVDAAVVKTGEPFASGNNWMFATFSQR